MDTNKYDEKIEKITKAKNELEEAVQSVMKKYGLSDADIKHLAQYYLDKHTKR